MADRKEGTVKWFNEKKEYGFISYKGEKGPSAKNVKPL